MGLFPKFSKDSRGSSQESDLFPFLHTQREFSEQQEIQWMLLNHLDLCLVDPFSQNEERHLNNIYSYISNRLQVQFHLYKQLNREQENSESQLKLPEILRQVNVRGFTNCRVLILLCYKKQVKDFFLRFFECSGQEVSQALHEKLDEKYDNEEEGLETDFQVGLRFNGKSFIVKKKGSLADLMVTSVDRILEAKGGEITNE